MKHFFLLTSFLLPTCLSSLIAFQSDLPPVDISLFMIEAKYDVNRQVKICEIQLASDSNFDGCDYIYNREGVIARSFASYMSQYECSFSFMEPGISDPMFRKQLSLAGWKSINHDLNNLNLNPICNKLLEEPPADPSNISDYAAILYPNRKYAAKMIHALEVLPGLIQIDRLSYRHMQNKQTQSLLFTGHPELEKIRPKWAVFPKRYSSCLAKKIKDIIQTDRIVIKPLSANQGKGVIMIETKDLDATLRLILSRSDKLKNHPDRGYDYWLVDPSPAFLVEEFIFTEPVCIKEEENRLYDITYRFAALMLYHKQILHLHFLESYADLADEPVDSNCSLIRKYSSSLVMEKTTVVPPEIWNDIQRQLIKPLLMMYKRILGFDSFSLETGLDSAVVSLTKTDEMASLE